MDLSQIVEESLARKAADAERFKTLNHDLCQICHAHGADKRSLRVDCGYAVHEVIPEAIDLWAVVNAGRDPNDYQRAGYHLTICKSCRGDLLSRMKEWRDERAKLRDVPKDHDGNLDIDTDGLIPVRVNGAIRFLTQDEWREYEASRLRDEGANG